MELRHVHVYLPVAIIFGLCLLVPQVRSDYIKATRDYQDEDRLTCNFTVEGITNACDKDLRQVFRILSVDDTSVLLGSTECLYVLDQDLAMSKSASIPLSTAGRSVCEFAIPAADKDLRCQNYISYGYESMPDNYRVCGTFSSQEPQCWECLDDGTDLTCATQRLTQYMPRTPSQNFTVIRTTESGTDYYFTGAIESHTSSKPLIVRLPNRETAVDDTAVITSLISNKWMYEPHDFVGEPIEHEGFIYFFFREKALEYENIGQIVYSRVARICKNDAGGTASPLSNRFTTYLKARLACSVGSTFPSYFNELQDIKLGESDNTTIYGLFTTPNAGTVSSAICRYDLDELEMLFNTDNRRGQERSTEVWQKITKHTNDQRNQRTCADPYNYTIDNIYEHLEDYPLMNTYAVNCPLGQGCNDTTRGPQDALAVFPSIQGQKLTLLNDSNPLEVLIGTNDRTIYQAYINETAARITKKYVIDVIDSPTITPDQSNAKWPYGVSYLERHNDEIYGTLDQCLFTFNPSVTTPILNTIVRRSEITTYNHTVNIPIAVTNVFQLFDAPTGTGLQATLTPAEYCTVHRFETNEDAKCKEFLHVHCQITNDVAMTNDLVIQMKVTSSENRAPPLSVNITVLMDNSEMSDVSADDLSDYDQKIAAYLYDYNQWLENNVTCDNAAIKDTCPSAGECCGNC